jgi:Transglutaminase-like superfamily
VTSIEDITSTPADAVPQPSAGIVRCGLALSFAWFSVRALGVNRALRLTQRLTRRPANCSPIAGDAQARLARRVAWIAAFYPGRALCLEQSIALYAVLRSMGYDARFRVGVRPYGFAAHAWVELGGAPIDEHPELMREMVPLPEWPL